MSDPSSPSDPAAAALPAILAPGSVARPSRPPPAAVQALSAATLRLYRRDWQGFSGWCAAHGHVPLPAAPAIVAAFLTGGPSSGGTRARRAAAIAYEHRRHGLPTPTIAAPVTAVLHASRRKVGKATRRQRSAQLARLATACPRDLAGLRDRALLLLARAAPGRHGLTDTALLDLTVEQLRFTPGALEILLPTHPRAPDEGAETTLRSVAIAAGGPRSGLCPVQSLQDWLHASATVFGPVFRKIDRWGNVEHQPLAPDALRRIIARRSRRRRARGVRTP